MDPLSEALRGVTMSGSLIARAELRTPWGLGLDRFDAAVFHVLLEGACWLDAIGSRRIRLTHGDVVVLMRGQAHELRSDPGVGTVAFSDLMRHCVPGRFPVIGIDGGGTRATMLCGFFGFDRRTAHPLLRALPDVIHVNALTNTATFEALLTMADVESAAPRPGSGAFPDLLCGMLLVHTLRAQLAVDPRAAEPWIRGLQDRRIGAALELIHAATATEWTVARLASEVTMSRSAFAQRFTECVGEAPMRYLARYRVLRAAQALGGERVSVAEAMDLAGYQSESSFAKAFRRFTGCTSAAYRASFRDGAPGGGVVSPGGPEAA
jgi:AraC-like DNA-binding protein